MKPRNIFQTHDFMVNILRSLPVSQDWFPVSVSGILVLLPYHLPTDLKVWHVNGSFSRCPLLHQCTMLNWKQRGVANILAMICTSNTCLTSEDKLLFLSMAMTVHLMALYNGLVIVN